MIKSLKKEKVFLMGLKIWDLQRFKMAAMLAILNVRWSPHSLHYILIPPDIKI